MQPVLTDPTDTSRRRIPLQRWRGRRTPAGTTPALPPGVRARRPRDVGACARLLRRAYFEGRFPEHGADGPRSWLEADEVMSAWVAETEGEIVAHVAISTVEPSAAFRWREVTGRPATDLVAVSRLFVRPRSRGEGIGTKLLAVGASAVRAKGRVPVIEVVTSSSVAPELYRDHGWRLRATDLRPGTPAGLWVHRYEAPPAR